jgi:phage baseplate assembly protein W
MMAMQSRPPYRLVRPIAVACFGLLSQCTSAPTEGLRNCAPVGNWPALAVILRDASTGVYSPFFEAKVVAYNTKHVDSTQKDTIRSKVALTLLRGEPGIYGMQVTAAGYTLHRSKVFTVKASECGGQTDTVVVTLKRQ